MERDEYGFLFPVITDAVRCISCGLCEDVCAFTRKKEVKEEPDCFYGWHKNQKTRYESTSGAAFVAITEVCNKLGVSEFYGAAYDDELMVHHIGVNQLSDLSSLKTSKYVQSEMGEVYENVMNSLKKGNKILFSGTPCQVDGLKSCVRGKYKEQLITIALICHGVATPMGYKKYLNDIERKQDDKIKRVQFRVKHPQHDLLTCELDSGNVYEDKDQTYMMTFGMGLLHRISCFSCPYTTPYRNVDFTISDAHGLIQYYPSLKEEIPRGVSCVIAHTKTAKKMILDISEIMKLKKVPLEQVQNQYQPQLSKPLEYNPKRERFLKKIIIGNKSFEKCAKREIFLWKKKMIFKNRVKKIFKIDF
ncbi:Coenzyme F420 hydrogenase/dehydrogenase, beta subunit C-terminal domain [Faecalicatena contorta]|uniref:Coenzyme F420 hydrogenase/dehydrogenase, beta subunit C-terminal domain n=1 Tax=Faecalicatena contorta TaxID=39482 RepID=UPI003217F6B7